MSKWPMIVLLAFFTLCCLIILMSFKKALTPFKKGKLLSIRIPWSVCHSKLVKSDLKFLPRAETPVSFNFNFTPVEMVFWVDVIISN